MATDGVLRRASAALQGFIPATRVDRIPQGLISLRTTAMLYRFTVIYSYTWLTSLVLRRMAYLRNSFIPIFFDLVIFGLFKLKIYNDLRRNRTLDYVVI